MYKVAVLRLSKLKRLFGLRGEPLSSFRFQTLSNEIALTLLAIAIGVFAGLSEWLMNQATQLAHHYLFAIPWGRRLSGMEAIDPYRATGIPLVGGLIMGCSTVVVARLLRSRPVDPIEANALHKGRLSLKESIVVAAQTVLSNGSGASVGLEAGYTQLSSAIASWIGSHLNIRPENLRLLVGCAAGAAIGAAFNAPIAGIFYAFELIIGSYSLVKLAPVALATLTAVGSTHLYGGFSTALVLPDAGAISWSDIGPLTGIGVLSGLLGIVVMKGVTFSESLFKSIRLPVLARPAVGGLLVGLLALVSPHILSSGHAAMHLVFSERLEFLSLLLLLVLKMVASSVSIGSGFRGGLFYASLYLGTLTGALIAVALHDVGASTPLVNDYAIVGMSAVAVSIIGTPITMVCLALEMTGQFSLTGGVLLANVVSMLTVRYFFGYSFATWRFHLRGETIRSAIDVSWERQLTVTRMMSPITTTFRETMSVRDARLTVQARPLETLFIVDAQDRYVGMISRLQLNAHGLPSETPLSKLVLRHALFLTPQMRAHEVIALFDRVTPHQLPVIDTPESRFIVGTLDEITVLKFYAGALERSRRELAGEETFDDRSPLRADQYVPSSS